MAYTLLVVDDEKTIRDLISFRLEYEGHQVQVSENGEQALERVKQSVPDLVVLDVMMPGISGYEVCKTLKGNPATAGVKVILLTARGGAQDEQDGLAAGADGFMTKPFRANLLIKKIDELLNAP